MRLLVCPSRVWRPVHGADTQLADVQLADTQLLKKELPPGCSFSSTWHGLPKEDDLPVSFLVPSLSHTWGKSRVLSCDNLWQMVKLTELFFTGLPTLPVAMTPSLLSHLVHAQNS